MDLPPTGLSSSPPVPLSLREKGDDGDGVRLRLLPIALALAVCGTPAIAQQRTVRLADVAGVWHVETMIGATDSVIATLDLSQTGNDKGWTMTFPDRAPIPVRVVTVGGDSVVWEAGPYTSTRRVGQTVTLRTVGHYKDRAMWGTFAAAYSVSGTTRGKIRAKRA